MKISGIYKIESTLKFEQIYIGSAIDISKRWNEHLYRLSKNKHENPRLQNHVNKYGISDLKFSIIVICSKEELKPINGVIWIEQAFIWAYKYQNSDRPYFNICPIAGSPLGAKRSEQGCRNIGNAKKGKNPWNKGKKGLQISHMKGKHPTIETRELQRKAKLGKPTWNKGLTKETDERVKCQSDAKRGEKHPMFGKHQDKEWIQKRKDTIAQKKLKKLNLINQN